MRSRTEYPYDKMPARSYDFPPKEAVSLWHLYREGTRGINNIGSFSSQSSAGTTHWQNPISQKARKSADLDTGQPPGYRVCGKGQERNRRTETK